MRPRTVGSFIRARRLQLGLTQEALAERISKEGEWLSQSDISRIETGRIRFPRPERLERIAQALEVSLGDLLASIAAVDEQGQLLVDYPAVAEQEACAPDSAAEHGLPIPPDDLAGLPVQQFLEQAHEAAESLLDELIQWQTDLLAVMSGDERDRASDVIEELDRVVQGWSALLREVSASGQDETEQPGKEVGDSSGARYALDEAEYFRRLLDCIGHLAIVTDPDGTIRFWNQRAEVVFGWKSKEVLGRNVVDVTPTQISRDEAMAIMDQLRAGDSWSGWFQLSRRDGSTFWGHVTDTPVCDSAGNLVAIIGITHDIRD